MTWRAVAVDHWICEGEGEGEGGHAGAVSIKRWGPGNWVLARKGATPPALQFESLRRAAAYASGASCR